MGLDAYYGGSSATSLPQQVHMSTPPQATPATAASAPPVNPAASTAPASATTPAAGAAQVAAANQAAPASTTTFAPFAPKGIQQFVVQPGDSFWALLAQQKQSVVDKNALSDDDQLKRNLGATPWLDQQSFGNRPANTPCKLEDMPIGGTVTLLDSHRLDDMNQQRQALADAQILSGPGHRNIAPEDRAAMLKAIVNPIVDEIDYASSGTGIVSQDELDKIVAPIAARAPNDPTFQSAITEAKQQVLSTVGEAIKTQVENATLDTGVVTDADVDKALAPISARAPNDASFQKAIADAKQQVLADMKQFGRTPEQLGQLLKDAASGDTKQLQGDLQAQLYSVGVAAEKDSPDDLVAASTAIDTRAGVYATYLGADAKKLIQDARATAMQQVTVEQPAQSVVNAYNSRGGGAQGAAAAAARLHQLTDPTNGGSNGAKITPAQAQAIMDKLNHMSVKPDDPHSVFKSITDGLAKGMSMKLSYQSADYKAAQAGMNDLAAAMQTLHDTDGPPAANGGAPQDRPGKAIVDQVASELYASIEANPDANEAVTREPNVWFSDSAKNGNVALSASIAAQFASAKQSAADSITLSLQSGLQEYQDRTLTPLSQAIASDYAIYDMGSKGYGNLKSPAGQDAMKALLQGLPGGGDKMTQDDKKLQQAAHFVGEVQWTLQDYATQIGWKKGGPSQGNPALQEFDGLMGKVDELDKATGMQSAHDAAANIAQTQHWWQDRVGVGVLNQLAKKFGNSVPNMTSNGAAQSAFAALFGSAASGKDGVVRKGLSPGLMSPLFLINAADTFGAVTDPTMSTYGKADFAGFAALYAGVGVSMALDAVDLKASIYGTTADGKAATPMRNLLDKALEKIDAKDISAGGKLAYKTAVSSVLENFSDVLGPVVAGLGVAHYLDTDGSDPAHATAFGLATVSDLVPTLAKQALSNATKDTLENIGLDFLARTTEEGWTGVGLAGNVLAAAIQYGANQYDKAHAGDKELTDYLLADGVKPEVAEPFARHATTLTSGKDAGAFLTAYFRSQGKSDADMVSWMNSIEGGKVNGEKMTPGDKADEIATFAKNHDVSTDKDGHYVIDTPGTIDDFQTLLKSLNVRLG